MNKKTIISICVGIFVLVALIIVFGQPSANQSGQVSGAVGNTLESSETLFDFGTISMANGKVQHEFRITNSSDQPVSIKKIYTSCMCTAANFKLNGKTYGLFGMPGHGGATTSANITMNPGDSGDLEVIYDPNAHGPAGVGAIDRFIYIEDKNDGQLELEIKAVVTP